MTAPLRLLHLQSSFSLGGKEARAVRLMNHMGARARHVIVSAMPGALGARDAIDPAIDVSFPDDAPPLQGRPGIGRYRRLARYMQSFDLVLSYNWGAMDAVMARRLFAPFMALPPLVHHEDGFNEDESVRRSTRRNGFRRLALPSAAALVVPSEQLQRIAAREWGAARRTCLIRNGIAIAAYGKPPTATISGLEKPPGAVVIGSVAGLRAVKNLPRLVQLAAHLHPDVRLAIVGEGPTRDAIAAEAVACGWDNRLVLPGFMPAPQEWIGHFDILALTSLSEQAPIAVIEAMAAGLPVVSFDVGDVAAMVAPDNRPFITSDPAQFRQALKQLVSDAALRRRVGDANRRVAAARFDETIMVAAYENLYGKVVKGRRFFAD